MFISKAARKTAPNRAKDSNGVKKLVIRLNSSEKKKKKERKRRYCFIPVMWFLNYQRIFWQSPTFQNLIMHCGVMDEVATKEKRKRGDLICQLKKVRDVDLREFLSGSHCFGFFLFA